MLDLLVLNPEPEDSPRTVPAGETPLRKKGVGIFFSRRESAVWKILCYRDTILLVWVVWVSSRRSLRTGPLTLRSCRWPSPSADQPCAAALALSSSVSSPSLHSSSPPGRSLLVYS